MVKKIETDYVVCGADAVIAHDELIDGYQHQSKKLNRLEPSLSGMVFLWGIKGNYPALAHHNIIFSGEYDTEFNQIFKHQRVPDDPTIYIAITSKTDTGHAPADSENWFVLLNMPYLTPGQMWAKEKVRMRTVVLDRLKQLGSDITDQIEVEQIYTPEDFSELYASNQGSIYGVSSNSRTTAFKRLPNRSRVLKGLYFAGGSVHPGRRDTIGDIVWKNGSDVDCGRSCIEDLGDWSCFSKRGYNPRQQQWRFWRRGYGMRLEEMMLPSRFH